MNSPVFPNLQHRAGPSAWGSYLRPFQHSRPATAVSHPMTRQLFQRHKMIFKEHYRKSSKRHAELALTLVGPLKCLRE